MHFFLSDTFISFVVNYNWTKKFKSWPKHNTVSVTGTVSLLTTARTRLAEQVTQTTTTTVPLGFTLRDNQLASLVSIIT
jgi:hypothetical protein